MPKRARLARAALLATALLGTCGATRPSAAAPADGAEDAAARVERPRIVMYLARRSWHIDVGFSVRDLGPSLAFIARRFPRASYVFFGFGDRHYLLARRKGSATLSGALMPGPGLILVTAIENSPAQAFGTSHVLELGISAVDTAAAQRFVRRSLAGDESLTDIPSFADGPYEGSLYYGAVQHYSALHTCNTWAAEALRSAGLPVRTRLVLFAGQLWRQARKIAARAVASSTLAAASLPLASRTLQSQGGGLPF
ncbi:MAG: DUF2459 domain-containing protein [Steroidobacteraceae bacterium]